MALVSFPLSNPLTRIDLLTLLLRQVDSGEGPFPHSGLRRWRAAHERR